jgi:hypothetical protein
MPQPTPAQRKAQFQPLADLLPQMLADREAFDGATDALENQQILVDGLYRKLNVLKSKIQPYGGATWQDYVDYGTISGQYLAEYAKLAPLRAAADIAIAAFNQKWTNGEVLYNGLLTTPGAVENTGGTPLPGGATVTP